MPQRLTDDMKGTEIYLKHLSNASGPDSSTPGESDLAEMAKDFEAFVKILKGTDGVQPIVELVAEKMMNVLRAVHGITATALLRCNDPVVLITAIVGNHFESMFRFERAALYAFAVKAELSSSASNVIDEIVLKTLDRLRALASIWKGSPNKSPEDIANAVRALGKFEVILGADAKEILLPYLATFAGMGEAVLAARAQAIPQRERERLRELCLAAQD
jgi:hypothetical protein